MPTRILSTLALTALLFMTAGQLLPAHAQEQSVHDGPTHSPGPALGDLLDASGRLVLPENFSGAIDPAGYRMVSGKDGEPLFVQASDVKSASSVPSRLWSDGAFAFPGCNRSVFALHAVAGELFIGGDFSLCGNANAVGVARFDPATGTFSALGSGTDRPVLALAAIGTDLYVGGRFNRAGASPATRIAVYDTTQSGDAGWSDLGSGVNSDVDALAVVDDALFVGGNFSEAGGAPAANIARYDPATGGDAGWSALGSGTDNRVYALAAIGSALYVGGTFGQAGGVAAARIAVYDTDQGGDAGWSALGSGVSERVFALAAIGTELYVGGRFTQAGGAPANRIARYDTSQAGDAGWSALGSGTNTDPVALAAIGTDLYVAGSFRIAGELDANRVAVYDTTQVGDAGWAALGSGTAANRGPVNALAALGDVLYVGGGSWDSAGGRPAQNIAAYDTTETGDAGWRGLASGINGEVNALAIRGNELFVGGSFTIAGDVLANNVAAWDMTQPDGTGWRALGGGTDRAVDALAFIGSDLYVGGRFLRVGDLVSGPFFFAIAAYDTTQTGNDGWFALGNGINGRVDALAAIGTDLYVGGQFGQAGGAPAGNVARYDTTQIGNAGWSILGSGVNSTVFALAPIGNRLYVGGQFTQAGGAPANRIAVYTTTEEGDAGWSALGSGTNNSVFTLQAIGDKLYVGGNFVNAGGSPADNVAAFDTTQDGDAGWSALGTTVDGGFIGVSALAAIGTDLYAAESSVLARDKRVAVYDTTRGGNGDWVVVGTTDGTGARTLAPMNDRLLVGGSFSRAGGNGNVALARYLRAGMFRDGFEAKPASP